jgi:hypothetical protein
MKPSDNHWIFRWRKKGRPTAVGSLVRFHHRSILWLLLSFAPCPGAEPLRTLAEVRALSDEAALAGQSVRVEAVVLYADPFRGSTIIHDGTAA